MSQNDHDHSRSVRRNQLMHFCLDKSLPKINSDAILWFPMEKCSVHPSIRSAFVWQTPERGRTGHCKGVGRPLELSGVNSRLIGRLAGRSHPHGGRYCCRGRRRTVRLIRPTAANQRRREPVATPLRPSNSSSNVMVAYPAAMERNPEKKPSLSLSCVARSLLKRIVVKRLSPQHPQHKREVVLSIKPGPN